MFIYGLLISITILTFVFVSLVYLIFYNFQSSYIEFLIIYRILKFTIFQSFLSVSLSCIIGYFVASSLVKSKNFKNYSYIFLSFCSLSFVMPTVVAGIAIIKFWGNNGIFGILENILNFPNNYLNFYGLFGILVAHIFFNAPLFTRIIYNVLLNIPKNYKKNSCQLNISGLNYFLLIELPFLRKVIPSICGLVFLLCFTSFSLILMFGGGPASSTLEVAIYYVIRSDFDLSSAARLVLIQIIICFLIVSLLSLTSLNNNSFNLNNSSQSNYFFLKPNSSLIDKFIVILFSCYIFGPLIILIISGLNYQILIDLFKPSVIKVFITSIVIALISTLFTFILAWIISSSRSELALKKINFSNKILINILDFSSIVYLLVPSLVLAISLYFFLNTLISFNFLVPVIVISSNILFSLPFATKIIFSKMFFLKSKNDKICKSLGIRGIQRFLIIDFPCLKKEVAFASGITACLSLGDLGAIALFGNKDFQTIPWLIYSYMSSYRMEEASSLAFMLLILCILFFFTLNYLIVGKNAKNP